MIANRYQPIEPVRPGKPLKARDLRTARTVVLHTVSTPEGGVDLIARAQMLQGISHPSLSTLVDCCRVEPATVVLVSEFVAGKTLRIVAGGQPLNARRAAEIVSEIADGVAELHARGVAHRAISIDSVSVTDKGRGKLDLVSAACAVRPVTGSVDSSEFDADIQALVALLNTLTARPFAGLSHLTTASHLATRLRATEPS